MLIMQARNLVEGARIWNRAENDSVAFLAGPWQNAHEAQWFVTCQDGNGVIRLLNLNDLDIWRQMPKEKEFWDNSNTQVYIVEVGDKYVIFKHHKHDGENTAVARLKNDFVCLFKKSEREW